MAIDIDQVKRDFNLIKIQIKSVEPDSAVHLEQKNQELILENEALQYAV